MSQGQPVLLAKAERIACEVQEFFEHHGWCSTVCGSIRRKRPVVHDIDLVISCINSMGELEIGKLLEEIWGKQKNGKPAHSGPLLSMQVDVLVVPENSEGAAILHSTGSTSFNVKCRYEAIKRGWKLNQYGLWAKDRNVSLGLTERDILELLGMKYKELWERG